jgi:hypothetical protein
MWPVWLLKFLPKFSVLAAQNEKHETEIMLLKDKHEKAEGVLKTENANLRAEVEQLKEELSKRPEPIHTSELSEIETKILMFIAEKEEPAKIEIAMHAGLSPAKLELHLTDLEEKEFIYYYRGKCPHEICTMRPEGLRYLDERNLLK